MQISNLFKSIYKKRLFRFLKGIGYDTNEEIVEAYLEDANYDETEAYVRFTSEYEGDIDEA